MAFVVWRANTYMCIAFSLWDQKKDIQRRSQSCGGRVVEIKSNLFSGTHCRLSPCTSRKHSVIFCQLSLCAIPNRALKIFFFLFSLGCALNPTSNNGPSSSWGKKKKKIRASSDCLCVVRVSGSFQKR